MSNFYKIERENEFAYFNANTRQLRQKFESDPNCVAGVLDIAQAWALTKAMPETANNSQGAHTFADRARVHFAGPDDTALLLFD